MEVQKSNKGLVALACVLCVLVLALGGFILYDKVLSTVEKSNITDNNNNNQIVETPIDNVVIKNSEINELYNYVQPSLNSHWVCLGYFYQNQYKNHTLANKVSLVLINYAEQYKKKIDENFLQNISQSERDSVKNNSEYYIEASVVKDGLKLLFNIDIDKFDDNANYAWHYRSDVNAFVEIFGGGDYKAEIFQQIIDYNELSDEINLTVVKAELGYDNNVYRYVNKENTLVYNNYSDKFNFTKENVNNFPQLKYVFKKNSDGKYYVSDIINLNFEQDYEECN